MVLTEILLSIGFSVMANFATDGVKKLSKAFSGSKFFQENSLRKLFIKSFYKALDSHNESYDQRSKVVTEKLRVLVKKDESIFIGIISRESGGMDNFLASLRNEEFYKKLAVGLVAAFPLDLNEDKELITGIISDCFYFYRETFLGLMNEEEALKSILTECLKMSSILDILKSIDSKMVSLKDFDDLKMAIYKNHFSQNQSDQKKLDDYNNYIKNKFRYIELRGFSPKVSGTVVQMELCDIFVPLEIKASQHDSVINGFHNDGKPLLDKNIEKKAKMDRIIQILRTHKIVILGDPGSGKSTLLKYLAIHCTNLRNTDHPLGCIIPVFLRISEFAQYLKNNGKNLYEFITDHLDKQYSQLFKDGFEYSNLLLFMDGLDEVTDKRMRNQVAYWVDDLMARYPFNHYVVTSRIVGYQESRLGAGFKHFELQPFGASEIATFSRQWYHAIAQNSDQDFDHADKQAGGLIHSISQNASVMRLASNPLLMTIIVMIYHKGKKLPNKRIELYDYSTETFLDHWVNLRFDTGSSENSQLKDKDEIIEIMAPIAFEIHEMRSNGLIEEENFKGAFIRHYIRIHTTETTDKAKNEFKEFRKFLRQEAGFFYEKGEDDKDQPLYGFIHLTFEEYLAAIHMTECWTNDCIDLSKYVFEPRWTEIIRLTAAQIRKAQGRQKATKFVNDLLGVEDIFPNAYRPLQLVCLILADDVSILDELYNKILNKIIEAYSFSGSKMFINSFSKLFKELLSSDRKVGFVDRIKKELIYTTNSIAQKNIVRILMENSEEKVVYELLEELLEIWKEHEMIAREIFAISWHNYPIQRHSLFRDWFHDFLKSFPIKEDEVLTDIFIQSFLNTIIPDYWVDFYKINWDYIKKVFDSFYGMPLFDLLFKNLFKHYLFKPIHKAAKKDWMDFLMRYPDNSQSKNLYFLLEKEIIENNGNHNHNWYFQLNNYFGYIGAKKVESGNLTELYLGLCKKDFSQLHFGKVTAEEDNISDDEICICLKQLNAGLNQDEVTKVMNMIFDLRGPTGNKILDIERYIQSYILKRLYYHGWQNFAFTLISHNPRVLSKIIAEQGERYINLTFSDTRDFSIDAFSHPDVNPPTRLLAYHFKKIPYEEQLVRESIDYYRTCPPEEKAGVFAILYGILNRLN